MKKKILIVILILNVLILLIVGMYLIDMNRMKNNKAVIFSTWGYDYVQPENIQKSIESDENDNSFVGEIMETYPVQINTNDTSADGYKDFEIIVEKSEDIEKKKILNNRDLYQNNSDYDLYYYGLNKVNVNIANKIISLEEALYSGMITLEGLIEKSKEDAKLGLIEYDGYYDGGTKEYRYDTYTIIKCHTIEGDRNVWIGIPEMTLRDIK